jgi:hypothetical protein
MPDGNTPEHRTILTCVDVIIGTHNFRREAEAAYLTLDRNPVLLPPRLAHLIEEQLERRSRSMVAARATTLPNCFSRAGHRVAPAACTASTRRCASTDYQY